MEHRFRSRSGAAGGGPAPLFGPTRFTSFEGRPGGDLRGCVLDSGGQVERDADDHVLLASNEVAKTDSEQAGAHVDALTFGRVSAWRRMLEQTPA